jgi:DNA (cytosine-5)-methyltransferase 1
MLEGYYVKKIGQNKGAPRVWLEGTQTERAGFLPGQKYSVTVEGRTVILQANVDGSRVVSSKKRGDDLLPVIDLNSRELLACFDGMSSIRVVAKKGEIYLIPLASELKKQERFKRLRSKLETGEPLLMGSLSHGAGILSHALHQGFKNAGIPTKLAMANDIREDLLEHAAVHNDAWDSDTKVYTAGMQQLAFDERGLASVPLCEIMEAGIPCSGASKQGRSKLGLSHPEAHPEVGHLVVAALIILAKANPALYVIENVPEYANTASASILRTQMRDLGYVTHERILNGKEWGVLENRNRWVMIGITEGIEFDFDALMPPDVGVRYMDEILESMADDDPRWSRMEGLKAKEVRDKANGKGFAMQIFDGNSQHISTITKHYAKVQSTTPKIRHPNNPDLLRQLTPQEHSLAKGIPPHLIEGLSMTIQHEALGQSVIYPNFVDVGHHVGNAINKFAGRAQIPMSPRKLSANLQRDLAQNIGQDINDAYAAATKKEPEYEKVFDWILHDAFTDHDSTVALLNIALQRGCIDLEQHAILVAEAPPPQASAPESKKQQLANLSSKAPRPASLFDLDT